jgi:hypothetical protein
MAAIVAVITWTAIISSQIGGLRLTNLPGSAGQRFEIGRGRISPSQRAHSEQEGI